MSALSDRERIPLNWRVEGEHDTAARVPHRIIACVVLSNWGVAVPPIPRARANFRPVGRVVRWYITAVFTEYLQTFIADGYLVGGYLPDLIEVIGSHATRTPTFAAGDMPDDTIVVEHVVVSEVVRP